MRSLTPARVLELGEPGLRAKSLPVADVLDPGFLEDKARLMATLAAFRAEHGFGRAIAAPQIGVRKRLIALNLGAGPFAIVNPEILWRDPALFTLWDDCMSFPGLLVRVERHRSVSVRFVDESGASRLWERLDRPASELLQHEIDHLDGILAVDRALDGDSWVTRTAFEASPEAFRARVDYVIA